MKRFLSGGAVSLGDREVGVVAATHELARDWHIFEPGGIDAGELIRMRWKRRQQAPA